MLQQKVTPERSIFLGFMGVILMGTVLLLLPVSHKTSENTLIDDLFTAVSATCVTGLSTVDTAQYWSTFGLVIVMCLIQVGGLGVMTLATALGATIQQNYTLNARLRTSAEVRGTGLFDLRKAVWNIIKTSLTIEAIGTLILGARYYFYYHLSAGDALWHGLFHSVSAFNNAGFAIYSDNLVGFASDPWILLPISFLIIAGGLGFPVWKELERYAFRTGRWSLTTKLVMVGTPLLLGVGTLGFLALEWGNPGTLGPMSFGDKLLNSFALSTSTRTAGFNSFDMSALHTSSLTFADTLMFIGGGPAGTAGGMKITTIAVLLLIVRTGIHGTEMVNIFGRRLAPAVYREAITVVILGIGFTMLGFFTLQVITPFTSDQLMFEVVSAVATVGLSTGITASMPVAGKLILIVLMVLGRIGAVTVVAALVVHRQPLRYRFPEERPLIG